MKKRTIILTFIILIIVLHCIVPVALFAADLPLSPNPIPSPRTYDAGHDLEQLRGSMCGDYYVEQNFNDLRAMGANLVRWHLMFDYSSKTDYSNPTVYTQWLESELVKAEIVAKKCKSLRMLMIIDLVSQFPGDTSGPTCKGSPIFSRKESADSFVHTWEVIAEHFKDDKTVWAFELLNEPQVPFIPGPLEEKAGQSDDVWNNLFVIATEHIRAIDPDRFVIYDPIMGCHPYSYILLSPLSIDRFIYTVHLYSPFDLTYQGLQTYPLSGATYPGNIWNDGWENWILSRQWTEKKNNWDKKTLRKLLQPVLDFQAANNVPIFIGEFNCTRWAPNNSSYRYIRDCIELFDEYNWDWSFHAFRSSDCWNPELTTTRSNYSVPSTPTDRFLLLQTAFRRNEYP